MDGDSRNEWRDHPLRRLVFVDGGSLISVNLGSSMALAFSLSLRAGHTYKVAVRATAGGTVGATAYSAPFVAAIKGSPARP